MNNTVKEPHLDPPDEEAMWCVEHGCESDACPDDESDCELIAMSEHHAGVAEDWAYDDWNDNHFDR